MEQLLKKIAKGAGVSKAIIHYYFRTKDNLYKEIIGMIADGLLHLTNFEYPDADLTWFLMSELRNNKTMFLEIMENKMGKDCEEKIQELIKRSMKTHASDEFT